MAPAEEVPWSAEHGWLDMRPRYKLVLPDGTEAVPSIDALKALQADCHLGDEHVVYLGPERFVIAHTDEERAGGDDLTRCEVHEWLASRDKIPAEPGYYVARRQTVELAGRRRPRVWFEFEPLNDAIAAAAF